MSTPPGTQAKLEAISRLIAEHKLDQARAQCQRLAQASPKDPAVAALLSHVLLQSNQTAQALHYAGRAAELAPADPAPRLALARLCTLSGAPADAERAIREALALVPGSPDALAALASLLSEQRRFTEALALCRAGDGYHPALRTLAAGCLLSLARADEAVTLLEAHAAAHPDDLSALTGAALIRNYTTHDPADTFAAHQRVGAWFDRHQPVPQIAYPNPPATGRALRVGILSPDLRQHSVASFIEPLLRHHDRSALHLTIYYTNRIEDHITRELRPLAGAWCAADTLPDDHLAQRIYSDRTDILIELSGLTHGSCLGVMHLRPAPVQVTYLGYPNTTGLRHIDYRLVDSITDPPGDSDRLCTERLSRLDPCFLCFRPPTAAPPSTRAARDPADTGIVFGSFNAAQKLSLDTIRLWTRAVLAVPGSRLRLKAVNFADAPLQADLRARFAREGLPEPRLDLLAPADRAQDHLAAYQHLDIALDPTPYHGTTTTCEALWMGVPVVSRTGHTHASRVGASILAAVGLPELARDSDEAFVAAAAALADDAARRADLRAGLRARMAASILCDGPAFARRFERAMRDLWAARTPA